MATVSVRYIVNDVDAAIAFYCENLGFTEVMHPRTGLARGQAPIARPRSGANRSGGGARWAHGAVYGYRGWIGQSYRGLMPSG